MSRRSNQTISESVRGTLASCLVIISAFVICFNVVGVAAAVYLTLFVVDLIYVFALWGYILLFTGKSTSETLKRSMLLFSVIGAAASVFLMWAVFTFHM